MKIAIITILYKDSINYLYDKNVNLPQLSYKEQKSIVDSEISIWASGWEDILTKNNFEVLTIPINISFLQKKWADENHIKYSNLNDIAFEQLKFFKPDILWYDYFDVTLLKKIRSNINSLKLVLGWTGSSIVNLNILKETDLVLSCAPETVHYLNNMGIKSEHLDHAFNHSLLEKNNKLKKNNDFIFIGNIIKGSGLHNKREELLKRIIKDFDIKIFTPSYNYGLKKITATIFKKISYYFVSPLKYFNKSFNNNLYIREILNARDIPFLPYDRKLKRNFYPPVYGRKMYNTIANSNLVLNIHADSSSKFASNMRLFEITGIGATLLTDWKKNINEYFKDGEEIITYKSSDECIEKIKWLLNNPQKCKDISEAGQKRTLTNYTYKQKVIEYLKIIENNI